MSPRTAPLIRVLGIAIDVHFTFFLIFLWGGWQGWLRYRGSAGILHGVAAMALLSGAVLFHELAHSVQARAVGWHVHGVILTPFGGVAQVVAQPAEPFHELTVAVAGPAANLGFAILAGVTAYVIQPFDLLDWPQYLLAGFPAARAILLYLFAINILLFATNMLPVFPMDGAQVVRAALALTGVSRVRATRFVVLFGRGVVLALLAAALVAAGGGSPTLALLSLLLASVVYFGARQEVRQLRRRRALTHLRVEQVGQQYRIVASPHEQLSQVIRQPVFRDADVVPVVLHDKLIGLLRYPHARRLAAQNPQATVAHAMQTRFPILHPRDTLISALGQMTEADISSLPIETNGNFSGMLSLVDVERALQRFDPTMESSTLR